MQRTILAVIASIGLVVSMMFGGSRALATWAGSVTDIVNSSVETQGCHDVPYYFKTQFGWTRACNGGHDIANSPVDVNIYIRGYVWTSAYLVDWVSYPVWDSTCTTQIGTEYRNAWQIDTPAGTAGVGFHHMGTHHYGITTPYTSVPNGTEVGEQANWGQTVYYKGATCFVISYGPHVHTEAAEVGTNFTDTWGFGTQSPNYPYISYTQP